jgi:hypothetical protein
MILISQNRSIASPKILSSVKQIFIIDIYNKSFFGCVKFININYNLKLNSLFVIMPMLKKNIGIVQSPSSSLLI